MLGKNGASTPPTAAEQALFNVVTSTVPKVTTQQTVTAAQVQVPQVQTVTVTNIYNVTNNVGVATPVPVPVQVQFTNYVTQTTYTTSTVTNMVPQYQLAAGGASQTITDVGGAVGSLFGVGGLVVAGLGALFGSYMKVRNNALAGQASTLNTVSGVLAQNVETLRNVIATTPQGEQLGALVKQYLITHQATSGTISTIAGIVGNAVDNDSAKAAAAQIQALLNDVNPPVVVQAGQTVVAPAGTQVTSTPTAATTKTVTV